MLYFAYAVLYHVSCVTHHTSQSPFSKWIKLCILIWSVTSYLLWLYHYYSPMAIYSKIVVKKFIFCLSLNTTYQTCTGADRFKFYKWIIDISYENKIWFRENYHKDGWWVQRVFLLGSMHSKVFQFRFYFFVLFIKSIEIMIPVRPSCKIIILTYFSQAELIWSWFSHLMIIANHWLHSISGLAISKMSSLASN